MRGPPNIEFSIHLIDCYTDSMKKVFLTKWARATCPYIIMVGFILMVSGCGQNGGLYLLPKDQPAKSQPK